MITRHKILASTALATLLLTGAASAMELTAAHVNPPGEPSNVAFAELEKLLAESSSDLSLTVFPQGQIGGEKDAIEQVQIGALSMTTVSTASLSAFAPSVGIYDMPFLFRDGDSHPWKVVDSELGAEIEAKIEAESNLEVLGWWSGGLRHAFTRDKPIETLADLKDQKIRVIGSPVYIDTFNQLGAKATPMPYGEVYTGLATGALDGAENDSSGYRNVKFFEQAPYYSLTGHFFLFKPVVANKDAMASLTAKQRAEFDAAFEKVTQMQRELFASNFDSDIAWLKENGTTVIEPERAEFIEAVQPVVQKYADQFGPELVQRIIDTQ